MALLYLEDCWMGFNDRELLRGVSLSVGEGERIGLLGRNGSGKSTLLKVLAGIETPDSGRRVLRRDVRLGYLEQDPIFDPDQTVREAVRAGLTGRAEVLAQLDALHAELAGDPKDGLDALLARQTRLEGRLEELGGHDVEHRIEGTLHALGLEDFEARCGNLSGGERRRVALARLQLAQPDLLLLDEPTNHLDAFVTQRLENWFLETKTPLLLVTHDRYFLDRVVDRIVELDRGQLVAYDGGYGDYLEQRADRLLAEEKAESSRLNLLRRETAWMRRGPPARTTRSKARVKQFHAIVDAAPTATPQDLELVIPPGPRLGSRVVRLAGITKSFGSRVVLPPLDLELEAGTRLGIVGPNGAGKSTLLKLILGELQPDAGEREVGETVRFMGIDQMRTALDPTQTVAQVVAGASGVVRTGDSTVRIESFLDKFGFPVSMQQSKVSQLSGGEQNRVLLAKLLCAGGNVLVLDEPTNDLDLATLRALEEALLVFPGALLLVSHDRWFLDRVATRILYLDGEGGVRHHYGDLSQLLEELAAADNAAQKARRETPRDKGQGKSKDADKLAGATPAPRAKRIAPWEQRELDELEQRIPVLEAEIAKVDEQLADPQLYAGPLDEASRVQARRAELDAELTELYGRWEELESLRSGAG